jgi:hypothetical protein
MIVSIEFYQVWFDFSGGSLPGICVPAGRIRRKNLMKKTPSEYGIFCLTGIG